VTDTAPYWAAIMQARDLTGDLPPDRARPSAPPGTTWSPAAGICSARSTSTRGSSTCRRARFVGITGQDYRHWLPGEPNSFSTVGNGHSFSAGRVAHALGLQGPARQPIE
jgi:3-oxoacyl-[acyl-carrier-protein] synthase II